jgi:hypothetical protein
MEDNIIKGNPSVTAEAFEVHQRIQGQMGEFFNNWMLVGTRPDGHRVLIGCNHSQNGWGHMQPVYDRTKQWQRKEIPMGNTD